MYCGQERGHVQLKSLWSIARQAEGRFRVIEDEAHEAIDVPTGCQRIHEACKRCAFQGAAHAYAPPTQLLPKTAYLNGAEAVCGL